MDRAPRFAIALLSAEVNVKQLKGVRGFLAAQLRAKTLIDLIDARIEKARKLMAEHKIDAILLTGGTSLVYFTGLRWGNSERLLAVLIPRVGNPYVVCPAFEEDRAREQLALGPLAHTDVGTWQEDESPFERVAQGLKDRGVGVSPQLRERIFELFFRGVGREVEGTGTGLSPYPREVPRRAEHALRDQLERRSLGSQHGDRAIFEDWRKATRRHQDAWPLARHRQDLRYCRSSRDS